MCTSTSRAPARSSETVCKKLFLGGSQHKNIASMGFVSAFNQIFQIRYEIWFYKSYTIFPRTQYSWTFPSHCGLYTFSMHAKWPYSCVLEGRRYIRLACHRTSNTCAPPRNVRCVSRVVEWSHSRDRYTRTCGLRSKHGLTPPLESWSTPPLLKEANFASLFAAFSLCQDKMEI